MGIWQRISSWWNKDAVEAATEDARDHDQVERDRDGEDFQGRFDDIEARSGRLAGGTADYERDSEPPGDPAP
jgi:hypothetical protein